MLRQSANVILVFAMILASNITQFFGIGRSISEQSDTNDTLLVPTGLAFSIWGPIFLGLIAYAVIQALPRNRNRNIYRMTGWWTALAMGCTALWGLAASLLSENPSRWVTAFLFFPIVFGALRATHIFTHNTTELSTLERFICWGPVSLYAGWVSIAMFLNWAQVGTYTFFGFGLSELMVCLLTLGLALAFAAWQLHRLHGNKVYIFSIIWGLAFLAYARLAVDDFNTTIGISAIIGVIVLAISSLVAGHRAKLQNR